MFGGGAALTRGKHISPAQADRSGLHSGAGAEQLWLKSLNSLLCSIQAFAGFAETARQLGLADSAQRAQASAAMEYRSAVVLLAKYPLPENLRSEYESMLEHLRSTLSLAPETPAEQTTALDARPASARPEPQSLDRLTPREKQVLQLIAEGHSSKQVASRLGISFRTATCHRYNVMAKLNLHDTPGLVRFAIRHGLVKA